MNFFASQDQVLATPTGESGFRFQEVEKIEERFEGILDLVHEGREFGSLIRALRGIPPLRLRQIPELRHWVASP